jgi:hypothetical protein
MLKKYSRRGAEIAETRVFSAFTALLREIRSRIELHNILPTTMMNPRILDLQVRRASALALCLCCVSSLCHYTTAQAQILRWEIEGTVRDIGDMNNIFTNVRLGDPVRGFVQYDRRTEPGEPNEGAFDIVYEHTRLQVAELVLENPRDGTAMEFLPDNVFALIAVTNDAPDEESGPFDSIESIQSVLPPAGFTGIAPSIVLTMTGPSENLADSSLPSFLDLDGWPLASIFFGNFFDLFEGFEVSASYFFAELHTLTPVGVPVIPGDYDYNGAVEHFDYQRWRAEFGLTHNVTTDGNENGVIDAADYVFWRNNFGLRDATTGASIALVPEPATFLLLLTGIASCRCRRPRRGPRA